LCRGCRGENATAQDYFDRLPLVHGPVRLRRLFQREVEVEDLAGLDPPLPHPVEQIRQVLGHRGRSALDADRAQADRPVTNDRHGRAWADAGGDRDMQPALITSDSASKLGTRSSGWSGVAIRVPSASGMRMYWDWQPSNPVELTQAWLKPARQCGQVPSEA
jgi:hypothetical protein